MTSPAAEAFERHRAAVRGRLRRAGVAPAGPTSVSWKINREIVVVAGWGRAILLQFAHPLVAAGVADHSHFRGNLLSSIGRLRSTVRAMLSLTFGDQEDAIAAAAGINCIHDRIHGALAFPAGVFPAGQPYSAHDPELLHWVHATLLDSVPRIYELLVGPLTAEERDRYCVEASAMEPLLDIPAGSLPRSTRDLDRYVAEMMASRRLVVTDTSRMLARALLYPPHSYVAWPVFRALRLISIGLLPPAIRDGYGFTWGPAEARAFDRWSATLKGIGRTLPSWLREWPGARRRPAPAAPAPELSRARLQRKP
jgi:uncharacterized protein (DUF2236 family)